MFKSHVEVIPIKQLIRNAKERRPGAKDYSEAMMLAYNKKNRYHLSLRMLYGGKNVHYDPEVDE